MENVVGGRLKLKGGTPALKPTIKKKKTEKTMEKITKTEPQPEVVYSSGKTAMEKKFAEKQAELLKRKLKERSAKSHRERIEEFNQKMESLSEHYDIPNVSGGG